VGISHGSDSLVGEAHQESPLERGDGRWITWDSRSVIGGDAGARPLRHRRMSPANGSARVLESHLGPDGPNSSDTTSDRGSGQSWLDKISSVSTQARETGTKVSGAILLFVVGLDFLELPLPFGDLWSFVCGGHDP